MASSFICGFSHLARSVALQLKHVHGVVDPPTVVVELDVPRQALDAHLDATTEGNIRDDWKAIPLSIPSISNDEKNYVLPQQMMKCTAGDGHWL